VPDESVEELEHRYKSIVDSLMMGVVIIGQDLRIATYNEQMRVWFPNIREGMMCREILGCGADCSGVGCLISKTFEDGCKHEKKFRITRDDEIKVYRMVVSPMRNRSGTVAAAVKVVEDVTEHANREATDIQTLQLAAVGQLAAGVAHEFNNINAVIKGHVELLLQDQTLPAHALEQIKVILDMTKHGVEITRNMLMFARDRRGRATGVYLAEIVRDVLSIVNNDLKSEGVELIVENQPNVRVMVNVSQIGQVLINLLLNARHALIGRKPKRLKIRTWAEQSWAHVSVEDSGCGIAEKNMKKLFSPFFTTKGEHAEAGSQMTFVRGTGLGLSICHTIIEKHHGGTILADSKEGQGAKFTIVLPLYEGPVEIKKTTTIHKVSEIGHGERVMVIDDEPKLLSLVQAVLRKQGYAAEGFNDSVQALKRYNEQPFDAVISDIKMPGLSGWEVVEYLNEVRPRPVIILMTGASQENESAAKTAADAVLSKPFNFEDLLAVLDLGLQGRKAK
jgi:signal transduction histidine kinase/ActR/RegA family two-component response regulator